MSQLFSVRDETKKHTAKLVTEPPLDEGAVGMARPSPLEAVVEAMGQSDRCGVVLAGEYGVGKTHMLRETRRVLSAERHVVSLRCSSSLAHVRFGVLSPLLGDLSESYLDHAHLVMRTLTKALLGPANGKPVVLFIDNVQNLDEESALIIAQLAVNKTISLVLACNSLAQTPTEIVGLWRDGMIRRLDLLPLTEAETLSWLEGNLGGRMSKAAARTLWSVGGGNPRFMSALAQEQIEAGTLVKRDGVWVVTGAELVYGNSCVDSVMTALGTLSAEELQVTELLALSGGMALNHLMEICSAVAVDALQQRGYLHIAQTELVSVRLATPLIQEVLRIRVPVGRSRELRHCALGPVVDAAASGIAGYRVASWTIECGMKLDVGQILAAAREATDAGHPSLALRILGAHSSPLSTPAAGIETARALMATGEHGSAQTILGEPLLDTADLALWLEARLLRSSLARVQPQAGVEAGALLDEIAGRLAAAAAAGDGHDPLAGHPELIEELSLVKVQQALHEGRYREQEAELEMLHRSARTPRVRYVAGLGLIEVKALTGKVQDAAAVAAGLVTIDGASANVTTTNGDPLATAISASVMAELTRHRLLGPPTGTFVAARIAAFGELADGVADAFGGRPGAALVRLVPAASQLEQLAEPAAARLCYAASAYAHALKGDDDAALACLNKGEGKAAVTSRLINTVCSYFQVLSSAELASKEKALIRLFALADEERRFGCSSVELMFVAAAVRMGATTAARRMVNLAGNVQGPVAEICAGYGRGLGVQDAQELLAMAEAAAAHHDDLFSRDIARAALRIARENADKTAMRQAQHIIRAGVAKLGEVKVTAEDGQVLTSREQEIAVLAAAGFSNKAIAAKMHISVRTVEGHLYQIYSKLQVSSRAELRETIS